MSQVIFQNQKFFKQFHMCNGIEYYFNRKTGYPIIAVGIYFSTKSWMHYAIKCSKEKVKSRTENSLLLLK